MAETIATPTIAEWCLKISNWSGISLGAEHYYGKLHPPNGYGGQPYPEGIELSYTPTPDQAAKLVDKSHRGDQRPTICAPSSSKLPSATDPRTSGRKGKSSKPLSPNSESWPETVPQFLSRKDPCVGEAAPFVASVGIGDMGKIRRLMVLGRIVEKAWRNHAVKKGFYFDLTPVAQKRVDNARREYYSILGRNDA